jgi:hypothetical protein
MTERQVAKAQRFPAARDGFTPALALVEEKRAAAAT